MFIKQYLNTHIKWDVTHNSLLSDPPEAAGGYVKVLDWLFIAGEEDVDDIPLHVDVWIDFRDIRPWNRVIRCPEHVRYIRIPFCDGDLEAAQTAIPIAKTIVDYCHENDKKVLVSCHAGISRSATLALWVLAEQIGYEKAWLELKQKQPYFDPDENFWPLLDKIKSLTRK